MPELSLRMFSNPRIRASALVATFLLGLLYLSPSFVSFDSRPSHSRSEFVASSEFVANINDEGHHEVPHDFTRDVSAEKYITLMAPPDPHPWDEGRQDFYFETVTILAHRLLHNEATKDPYNRSFIVIATDAAKPRQLEMLRELGAEVQVVAAVPPPSNVNRNTMLRRWKDQYTKLLLWNMTEYRRFVYIDAV